MDRRLTLNGHTRRLHRSLPRDSDADPRAADWTALQVAVAPMHGVGFGEWFSEALDRLVLAMAVAGAQDDPSMLYPDYAEGMARVFDDYFGRGR